MKLKLIQSRVTDRSSNGNEYHIETVGLYVDTETGVEYFIMNAGDAGAICPRIGKDGNPIIYKTR